MCHARIEFMRQGHAERLCPMIDEVMAEAQIDLRALDTIAVTVGPGTFTGVRLGLATARGFALATGAKLLSATSLSLLAATARARLPDIGDRPIVACIPGRQGEVMLEIIRFEGIEMGNARLLTLADAIALIAAEAPDALLIGPAAKTVAEAAAASNVGLDYSPTELEPEARYLADLPLVENSPTLPLYLRPPDAKPPSDAPLLRAS